jgi:hypothetical protein
VRGFVTIGHEIKKNPKLGESKRKAIDYLDVSARVMVAEVAF